MTESETPTKKLRRVPPRSFMVLLMIGFAIVGGFTILTLYNSIGVQDSTVAQADAFESIEYQNEALLIHFTDSAVDGLVTDAYVLGPDGTVVSRSEVLPRQTTLKLSITRPDGIGVTYGTYTVVALDESGDVVSDATVKIGMGDIL